MPHGVHRQELLELRQRGKCIVIDCYKRLPSSRSIKLFQNWIWRLRTQGREGSFSAIYVHAGMPFKTNYRLLLLDPCPHFGSTYFPAMRAIKAFINVVTYRQMEGTVPRKWFQHLNGAFKIIIRPWKVVATIITNALKLLVSLRGLD